MAQNSNAKKSKQSAENIVLHDSAGRPRVMIGMIGDDECPTFQLLDTEGRARITLQLGPTGQATFGIQEANGSKLIGLGADPSGDGGIAISLTRPGGTPILSIGWSESAGLSTSFWGQDGKPAWQGFEPDPVQAAERQGQV